MKLIKDVILLIIGLLMMLPFTIDTVILGHTYHFFTFKTTLFLILFIIGEPMVLYYSIKTFIPPEYRNTNRSGIRNEVQRIRYVVERDRKI